MTDEDFYSRCAEILGVEYACEGFRWKAHGRTRWNNRRPGHGRFEGFGIIRRFGDQVQIALRAPVAVSRTFPTADAAIAFLNEIVRAR